MVVDKEVIKQKKATYGNNFPDIAKEWSEYLNIDITPNMVSEMMVLMKQTRINSTVSALQDIKKIDSFHLNGDLLLKVRKLNIALEDSKIDFANYKWIADNYDKYELL